MKIRMEEDLGSYPIRAGPCCGSLKKEAMGLLGLEILLHGNYIFVNFIYYKSHHTCNFFLFIFFFLGLVS